MAMSVTQNAVCNCEVKSTVHYLFKCKCIQSFVERRLQYDQRHIYLPIESHLDDELNIKPMYKACRYLCLCCIYTDPCKCIHAREIAYKACSLSSGFQLLVKRSHILLLKSTKRFN